MNQILCTENLLIPFDYHWNNVNCVHTSRQMKQRKVWSHQEGQTTQWPKVWSHQEGQTTQWPKEKGQKRQTMIDKTPHRKLNIDTNPNKTNQGWTQCVPVWYSVLAPIVTPVVLKLIFSRQYISFGRIPTCCEVCACFKQYIAVQFCEKVKVSTFRAFP